MLKNFQFLKTDKYCQTIFYQFSTIWPQFYKLPFSYIFQNCSLCLNFFLYNNGQLLSNWYSFDHKTGKYIY